MGASDTSTPTDNGKSRLRKTGYPAPDGGVRVGGKFYRTGQLVPARYGRRMDGDEPSRDLSVNVKGAPPNFGRYPFPHVLSFNGLMMTIAQAYRNPDEAIKHSRENAIIMRQDPTIMECIEARQRGTALLGWHLEAEDPKSPLQKQIIEDLTAVIRRIPRFTEYRRNLMEAIWCGRCGVQNVFGIEKVNGKRQVVIKEWRPINGDKLLFRYDDGSRKFDEGQVGIRVYGGMKRDGDVIGGDRVLEMTDFGMGYFFEPWERRMLVIHRHMIEDAAYENPMSAGSIHGIGIRSRIYWAWWQKQEALTMLMEFMQRSAMGIWIYYFPAGNKQAENEMLEVAKKQSDQNIVLMPRTPGTAPGEDGYGIDRVDCDPSGLQSLEQIVNAFFGGQIKRYILGQTLSTEAAATGLGSGVADLHRESLNDIIRYDASNHDETLTSDLIENLKNWRNPAARNVKIWFRSDTRQIDLEGRLSSVQRAWEMGARLKESEIMEIVDLSIPTEEDRVLQNPAAQQQQRLWEQSHPWLIDQQQQEQSATQAAGAASAAPGSEEDMFGPALAAAQQLTAGEGQQQAAAGQPGAPAAVASAGSQYRPQIVAQYIKTGVRFRYRQPGEGGDDLGTAASETGEPTLQPSSGTIPPPGGFGHEVDFGSSEEDRGEDTDPNLGDTLLDAPAGQRQAKPEPAPGPVQQKFDFPEKTAEPEPSQQPTVAGPEQPEASQALAPQAQAEKSGADYPGPAPIVHPEIDATTPQQRHDFARSQISQVHPMLARAFNAFHQASGYRESKVGPAGEYFAHHVAEQGARNLYRQLVGRVGQEWGGGQVVDLSHRGEGWIGVSTPAGAMVLLPPVGPAGKWRTTYTVNTGPVRRAMTGQALWPPNVGANAPQSRKFWQPTSVNQPPVKPIEGRRSMEVGLAPVQQPATVGATPPAQAAPTIAAKPPAVPPPLPPPLPGRPPAQSPSAEPVPPPITAARYRDTADKLKTKLDALTEAHDAAIRSGTSYGQMNLHRQEIRQARTQWREAERIAKDSERSEAEATKKQDIENRKAALAQQATVKQAAKERGQGQGQPIPAPGTERPSTPAGEKPDHYLTREEFVAAGRGKVGQHKQTVKDAMAGGQSVPLSVLRQYPELIVAAARTRAREQPGKQPSPLAEPPERPGKSPEIKHAVPTFDQTRELQGYGHAPEKIAAMTFDEARGHVQAGRQAASEKQAAEKEQRFDNAYHSIHGKLTNLTNREQLESSRALFAALWPEYLDEKNEDVWGIGRAIRKGDEIPRVPTVELSRRIRQAQAEGRLDQDGNPIGAVANKPREWPPETINAVTHRTAGTKTELENAGLPVTDAAENAIYELFQRNMVVDQKGLRAVLAAAAKRHAAGNVQLDPTAAIMDAARAHSNRRESRVDVAAAISAAALEHEVDGNDLAEQVDDVWREKNDSLKARERLKADVRASLGMDAGTIARLENQGLDYTADHPKLAGFDAKARNLAGSHPELFTGGGYEQEGGAAANYAEQLWSILREGARQPLAKHDPAIIGEAVKRLRSLKSSAMTPEQLAELQKVPFSRKAQEEQAATTDQPTLADVLLAIRELTAAASKTKTVKRVVRDKLGRIERIIEE